jgi:FKBP-type peptidyl-prolyl cis-trans isomerase SlyD
MTETVSNGKVISLEYTVKLDDNQVVDTNVGTAPFTYTQGANQIIRGVENAVEGMKVGETKHVVVPPEDGFGSKDLTAVQEVPKKNVPKEIKVGSQLNGKDASGKPVRPIIKEIKDDTVVLDLNHPLAGKTLFFDVKVVDVL